jgi:enoyl-CoA hydratase
LCSFKRLGAQDRPSSATSSQPGWAIASFARTSSQVDAERAERRSLVGAVVPAEDLLDAAFERAAVISANSPFGARLTKRVLYENVGAPSLEAGMEIENRNQVLATRTEDMIEALSAFREKRPPSWRGR